MQAALATKRLLTIFCVAVLVAGCGEEGKKEEAEKQPSQVAARVNGSELTVHQINFAMQRAQNVDSDNAKAMSRQAIKALVEQELLVQQGVEEKLDRDPAVVQALDAARRQIVSEAYLARKLGAPVEPAAAEVADYYKTHPELFSQRKVYQLQEVVIKAADESQKQAIRGRFGEVKNLKELLQWLQKEQIPFTTGQSVKAAEQLPRAVLPMLAKTPAGQAMVVNAPGGLALLMVAAVKEQPVPEDKAAPVIVRLIQQEKRQAAIKAEVDALRAKAKIEYLGEFQDVGAETPSPAEKSEAASGKEAVAPGADAINKGVSGL